LEEETDKPDLFGNFHSRDPVSIDNQSSDPIGYGFNCDVAGSWFHFSFVIFLFHRFKKKLKGIISDE
jgi:hypothetical protein